MQIEGEKIVWQSRGGGVAGHNQIVVMALGLLGFCSFGGLITPLMLLTEPGPLDAARVMSALGGCIWPLMFIGILVPLWLLPRLRPCFFLGPQHLFARKSMGGMRRVPLAGLQHVDRVVVRYRGRYGEEHEVLTHRVDMQYAGGKREDVGPIADVDALVELLESVIAQHVSIDALPGVDGELAKAEERKDVFLAVRTETDGMKYGSLFAGPTRFIRITEELTPALLARLYTVVAEADEAVDIEARVMGFLRHPSVGHYLDIPRTGVKATIDRGTLFLKLPDREISVGLAQRDADRLRPFLRG